MEVSDTPVGLRFDAEMPHSRSLEFRPDNATGLVLLLLALLVVEASIYWRVLTYPFISDDWGQLDAMVNGGSRSYLASALSLKGKLFYRPFSTLYFVLYHGLFGLNPVPFHIVGLLMHLISSSLVCFISWKLTRNRLVSYVSGLIYLAAITIHLDPLLWLVGFYDLAGSLFYLASLSLFLAKRKYLSAAAFVIGMLAKESAAVVLVVTMLVMFYVTRPPRRLPDALCRDLWPHGLAFVVYFLVRVSTAISPFSLPAGDPYTVRLFGIHILKNLFRYTWWCIEAVTPFRSLSMSTVRWILWAVIPLAGWLFFSSRRSSRTPIFPPGWIAFLAAWAAVGIVPALFLPNHYYKYYLIYALPPVILLWLSALSWIAQKVVHTDRGDRSSEFVSSPGAAFLSPSLAQVSAGSNLMPHSRRPLLVTGIFVGLTLVNALSAAGYFTLWDRAGVSARYTTGTNHLVHRGHASSLVMDYLVHRYPRIPKNSIFIVDGCELESIGNDSGLRTLFKDDSIRAFSASTVEMESDGRYLRLKASGYRGVDPPPARIQVERGKLFFLRVAGGGVQEEDPFGAAGSK